MGFTTLFRKPSRDALSFIRYGNHHSKHNEYFCTALLKGVGMKEIKIAQKWTDGKVTIDMEFKSLDQLFDASDPFP
jgi:hypothetical protein